MTLRLIAVAPLAAAFALGCASRTVPPADYIHGPVPHQARRATDYATETLWSTLAREAYRPLARVPARRSPDQDLVIREFGPPSHERRFDSIENEAVVEWLNIDHNQLFQFVGGRLVFQGEIRDLEHTLLRHGQPSIAMYHQFDPEIERVTFVYAEPYTMERLYFNFANGMLDFEERHN